LFRNNKNQKQKIMKQIIITVLCAFATLCGYAQEKSGHLLFKGVPIDGTVNSFVQKMKQKGFTTLTNDGQTAMMKGTFAGYKNCDLHILRTTEKDLVYRVGVFFEPDKTWEFLALKYFSLKQMLTKKYGKPSYCVEEFNDTYQPKDDMMKMFYVEQDKCDYGTDFETDEGTITLKIVHAKADYEHFCSVMLVYNDKKNNLVEKESASDDL